MKTTLPFLIAVLLMSAVLIACSGADATATPAPTVTPRSPTPVVSIPLPTNTPAPSPTNTPTAIPTVTPTGTAIPVVETVRDESGLKELPYVPEYTLPVLTNSPAEHTNEEIARSAEAVLNSHLAEAMEQPQPDYEAMAAGYASACIPDSDALGELADDYRFIVRVTSSKVAAYLVNGVQRIDGSRAWISVLPYFIKGNPGHGPLHWLSIFENGQWRIAWCMQEPDGDLVPPDETGETLRVYYLGEQVQVEPTSERPFAVTVLGSPEVVSETLVTLPIRYTSITHRFIVDPFSRRWKQERDLATLALPHESGRVELWTSTVCEGSSATGQAMLIRGGWVDTQMCFEPAGADKYAILNDDLWERPLSWLELPIDHWYNHNSKNVQPLVVDLTTSVTPARPARFENGLPLDPVPMPNYGLLRINRRETAVQQPVSIGDTISFSGGRSGEEYAYTILSPLEVVEDSKVRIRIRVESRKNAVYISPAQLTLTGSADSTGRLTGLWWRPENRSMDHPFPEGFRAQLLERGASIEAYVYFLVREGHLAAPETLPSILWVNDVPVYLTNEDA